MSTKRTASIRLINNTCGKAQIEFSHRCSSDPVETYKGTPIVPSGGMTDPLPVNYTTGIWEFGYDWFYCKLTVLEGPFAGRTLITPGKLDNPGVKFVLREQDEKMDFYFPVSIFGVAIAIYGDSKVSYF